jgi:hypothetical protein
VPPVPSNNYSLTFGIDELESNVLTQAASGSLTANSIAVSEPITCSAVNVSLFPGGGGLLNTPQIMLAKFIAPTGTLPSYAKRLWFFGIQLAAANYNRSWRKHHAVSKAEPAFASQSSEHTSNGALVAPPPYYDPPPGGYTGSELNPYPLYYPAQPEPPDPNSFFTPGNACTVDVPPFCGSHNTTFRSLMPLPIRRFRASPLLRHRWPAASSHSQPHSPVWMPMETHTLSSRGPGTLPLMGACVPPPTTSHCYSDYALVLAESL